MPKILYSGKDSHGHEVTGFVEAEDNATALEILDAKGVTDVLFHNESSPDAEVKRADNLSGRALSKYASGQIAIRRKPGFATLYNNVFGIRQSILMVGLVLLVWGWLVRNMPLLIFSLAVEAAAVVYLYWRYRRVDRWRAFQKAYALGQWDRALQLAATMRAKEKTKSLLAELLIREACIAAKRGSLADGLAVVERGEDALKALSPALRESRLAAVYASGGDYHGALARMRRAAEQAPKSQVHRLDWASAEARFGDLNRAEEILATVVDKELPEFAKPYLEFVKGLIAQRRGDPSALAHLQAAYSAQPPHQAQPALWLISSELTAHYALALYDAGQRELGEKLLKGVWQMLEAHAEPALRSELAQRFSIAKAG
jgi:hypothetical protein